MVVPLQRSSQDPGLNPLAVGGQTDRVLLVVIHSYQVQHLLQRLPAGTFPSGPLLEAGKAEAVKAEDHTSYIFSVAQAEGAPAVCCCL